MFYSYPKLFVVCLLAVASASAAVVNKKLKVRQLSVLHEWKDLDFGFPFDTDREFAVANGLYVKGSGIPVDFDIEYGENAQSYRTFVTVPRLSGGIPFTLATFRNNGSEKNPELLPYPNYFMHTSHGADCNEITSAIRIFIDECWRLWVVDSGQIASVQFCPPQILAFDLVSDRLVHRYTIPHTQYTPGVSVFTSAIVDVRSALPGGCSDARIYIADPWGYGLIVYDTLNRVSWRIEDDLMQPDRSLLRDNYISDGIFTLSLSPKNDTNRKMYFHALSSKREIVVPLKVIDDQRRWENDSKGKTSDFKVLGNRRIQCESEATDSAGNLYCSLLNLNSVISWDGRTKYNSDNLKIYAHNPDHLKFVTAMKVVKNSQREDELWALSNDPKLFFGGDLTGEDSKFKIVGCRVKDFLSGKPCTVDAL